MSDPFVAEICIFAFDFAPVGWAQCNGQILPISQNTALFSLLGTTYGGNGQSTFALPDLQARVPIHPGQGKGLSLYDLGQQGGTDAVTLSLAQQPLHNHSVQANINPANLAAPSPLRSFARSSPGNAYSDQNASLVQFAPEAVLPTGKGLPHNNMMPTLPLNFCIALAGVFPKRP